MTVFLTLNNLKSDETWKKGIPLIDGFGKEGIGSMLQYHLLLSFLSDYINIPFTYPGSKNFAHHSYTEYSENDYFGELDKFFNFPNVVTEWDEVINFGGDFNSANIDQEFFSLVEQSKNSNKNILINMHNCHRAIDTFCSNNIQNIFTKERVDRIRNNLIFNGKKYFDDDFVNISWHIRTANPNDIPAEIVSPYRDLYVKEKSFERYSNLVLFLKENTKTKKTILHIHSQGFCTDFSEFLVFEDENFQIKLHIDDTPMSDIYHMSNADLFVMSNSAFSTIPSVLSSSQKIVRDNHHTWTFNSIKTNHDFTVYA